MRAAVRRIVTAAHGAWRRLGGSLDKGTPPPVLSPWEAYRRWAPTYDAPETRLQALEAKTRRGHPVRVRGARILDVGCGTGRVGRELLRAGAGSVVGLDFVPTMLERARSGPALGGAGWVAGEASLLPFPTGAFDGAVCALMLGHLADPLPALAELARVVRPGGWLIVSDFHPEATLRGWARTFVDEGSGRSYRVEHTPHALEACESLLGSVGFVVESVSQEDHRGTPVVFVLLAHRSGEG